MGNAAWDAALAFVRDHAYAVIFVLSVILYNLGFARKLPLLKTVIVYLLLAIGCVPLTVLYALGLPIVPALLVGVALLVIVQIRRRAAERRKEGEST
ncbi:MAG TPA: YlaH-like family protein [Calditerricola sp.]